MAHNKAVDQLTLLLKQGSITPDVYANGLAALVEAAVPREKLTPVPHERPTPAPRTRRLTNNEYDELMKEIFPPPPPPRAFIQAGSMGDQEFLARLADGCSRGAFPQRRPKRNRGGRAPKDPPKAGGREYQRPDAAEHFLRNMLLEQDKIRKALDRKIPLRMSQDDWAANRSANDCHVCDKPLRQDSVRDHCRIHGKIQGSYSQQVQPEAAAVPQENHHTGRIP